MIGEHGIHVTGEHGVHVIGEHGTLQLMRTEEKKPRTSELPRGTCGRVPVNGTHGSTRRRSSH